MDAFALLVLIKVQRINTSLIRLIAAAAIGALWVCIIMVLKINIVIEMLFSYIVIVIIMVKIVAYAYKFTKILKMSALLYLITFTMGGMAHFLYYYTYCGYFLKNLLDEGLGPLIIIMCSAMLYLLVRGVIERHRLYDEKLFKVKIVIGNTEVYVNALYDSGNTLIDPIYNKAVNVVERDKLQKLVEKNGGVTNLHYRLIPYSSLGNKRGIIPVIDVDYICIYKGEEIKVINKAAVAVYDGVLSKHSTYSMLLNTVIFEKQEV